MAATPEELLARLDELEADVKTTHHPPVFTVAESKARRGDLPGTHCKCLFLKDKKGALWLVVTTEDRKMEMKDVRRRIDSAPLSFARPELLRQILGVEPGSVTPFALINDTEHRVNVILDAEMMALELLNYHPLTNTATTSIGAEHLLRFIDACGHQPRIVRL